MSACEITRLRFALLALLCTLQSVCAQSSPSITQQPHSQSQLAGTNVGFSVTATGQTPLFYTWQFYATNLTDSSHINGATNSILNIINIGAADAGNYRVIVSNSHGSATSSNAALTVLFPPAISGQPVSQSVLQTSNVTFSAAATGTPPLRFRWLFNGTPLTDSAHISGSTKTNLTISNIQFSDAGSYQLVATNNYGSATSSVATLTVLMTPSITLQPVSQAILQGSSALFAAAASGSDPLSYHWYFNSVPLADDGRIVGSTTTNLAVSNVQSNDAGAYLLVVTNQYGATTSLVATLTVLFPPVVTAQPVSQTVFASSIVTFTVTAMGTAPLSYHWQFNSVPISDANDASVTLTNVQFAAAGNYSAVVGNTDGSVTSAPATLTVVSRPSVLLNVDLGDGPFGPKIGPAAVGLSPTDTWNMMLGAGTMSNLVTAVGHPTQAGLTIPYGMNNWLLDSARSGDPMLDDYLWWPGGLGANAAFSLPPGIYDVYLYSHDGNLQVTSGGVDYGWKNSYSSFPLTTNWQAGKQYVVFPNIIVTNPAQSIFINVQHGVQPDAIISGLQIATTFPWIYQQPSNAIVAAGNILILQAGGESATPAYFQWYSNGVALTDGGRVTGANSNVLAVSDAQLSDAGNYFVVYTNAGGIATSSVATVQVGYPPMVVLAPTNQMALLGTSAQFIASISGTDPVGFQWLLNSSPLSDDAHRSGSTSPQLTITNLTTADAGSYVLVASNLFGVATSPSATLTILVPANIVSQPANQYALLTENATFMVGAIGDPPLSYQWFFGGAALSDGGRLTGTTSPTLLIQNVQPGDLGNYTVVVSNAWGMVTSTVATLSIPIVRYVNGSNPTPSPPYTNWAAAAVTIQDAIDVSAPGDRIWVADGTYASGGRAVRGTLPSRVAADRPVVIRSVNGPQDTFLQGVWQGIAQAANSVRCAYLTNGASLSGFTLKFGGTHTSGDWRYDQSGGGVMCESTGASISNCTILQNFAYTEGGGAFSGTLNNCTLSANTAFAYGEGGGAASSALNNCILTGNHAAWGGGAIYGSLNNCTISGNTATNSGGGVYGSGSMTNCSFLNNSAAVHGGGADYGSCYNCLFSGNSAQYGGGAVTFTLVNCTVVGNSASAFGNFGGGLYDGNVVNSILVGNSGYGGAPNNYYGASISYSCTTPDPGGVGNITADPAFVDQGLGNFRLQYGSPCINAGSNGLVATATDLDGRPRIADSTVDMGAYEFANAPWIFVQPTNQTAPVGSNVTFSVTVLGAPSTYQWWFNDAPLADGGRVSGSTSPTLSILNSQTNDSGLYQITATNASGMATSAVATLAVVVPVVITNQPANLTVLLNSNATFSVGVASLGTPAYQWYQNGAALTNAGRISGATSASLKITGVQSNDAGPYQVIVTNIYGSATSEVATLTAYAPAQITMQPASLAILLHSNAIFTAAATGTAIGYHWFRNGVALSDGARIGGTATTMLGIFDVLPFDAGGYTFVVTNLLSTNISRVASLTVLSNAAPSLRFVNLNNLNPVSPYLNWDTAATNIQDAIDAAVAGDSVIVSNGTYSAGGRAVYQTATNRVTIDKPVSVQSLNGPGQTMIQGFNTSPAALRRGRCAYMTNGAILSGFTLTSGYTATGDVVLAQSGGGAWCESSSAVISNCVLTGNTAGQYGGGAFRGTLVNCVMSNNFAAFGGGACSNLLLGCTLVRNATGQGNYGAGAGASYSTLSNCLLVANNSLIFGGGAFSSTLTSCVLSNNGAYYGGGMCLGLVNNCLISSNHAIYGGGACSNTLNNCVLAYNSAARDVGGGAYNSTLFSCTVVSNSAGNGAGLWGGYATNSVVYFNGLGGVTDVRGMAYCCVPPGSDIIFNGLGAAIITNDPRFVNLAAGDFRLTSTSPCINSGNNAFVPSSMDFDGNPRIVGGTVDLGAYEFQPLGRDAFNGWLQQYGLPTDGSATYADPDHDGLNNLQEWIAGTVPTNPASALRIVSATPGAAGVTLVWQSVSNRAYIVERSSDLAAHPPFLTLASNLPGQSPTTAFTDITATGPGPFFYRIGVQADTNHLYTPFSVISYAWLQKYGLPTDGTADFADPDGDGMNNWQEWKAGTNPTNATSVLRMITPGATNNAGGIIVRWQSVANVTYYLQRSTNLLAQPAFITIRSNVAGVTGAPASVADTNAVGPGPFFYRVGVQ